MTSSGATPVFSSLFVLASVRLRVCQQSYEPIFMKPLCRLVLIQEGTV